MVKFRTGERVLIESYCSVDKSNRYTEKKKKHAHTHTEILKAALHDSDISFMTIEISLLLSRLCYILVIITLRCH